MSLKGWLRKQENREKVKGYIKKVDSRFMKEAHRINSNHEAIERNLMGGSSWERYEHFGKKKRR